MSVTNSAVVQIGARDEPRYFTLAEARDLFPVVRRITEQSYRELQPVKRQLENLLSSDPLTKKVELQYEAVVKSWVSKLERLGLVIKGLWLVDFDTGDGYLCWKYPELRIGYFHDYSCSFSGRRKLEDVIEELLPDWA